MPRAEVSMKSLVFPITVLLTITGACHRDREREKTPPKDHPGENPAGTTTLTGASWLANAGAVERIAASRCARETACGRVGPNKRFADDQNCLREIVRRSSVEVEAQTCPNGVDAKKVERCETEISHQPCTPESETVPACQAEELCLRNESP
jgi:hypothetical protein